MIPSNDMIRCLGAVFERRAEDGMPGLSEAIQGGLVRMDRDGYDLTNDGKEVHRFACQLLAKGRTEKEDA